MNNNSGIPFWGKNPQGWKQKYVDNYILWTQLVGCIGIFGGIFMFLIEPNFLHIYHHPITWSMEIIGVILCTFNWAVDPM